MSLADALNETPGRSGGKCILMHIRDTLSEVDRATLDKWNEDTRAFTAPKVAKALRASGHTISASSIRNHRAGDCPCYGVHDGPR